MKKQDILIVEDEILSAKFLRNILHRLGHSIVGSIGSGAEALEVFKKQKVDFVFMDINLAWAMDGIECAKKLNEYREVPIIFVTGFGESEIIEEANETNIYGYLIKPYDERDIEAVLVVAMHKRKNETKIVEDRDKIEFAKGCIYDLHSKILMCNQHEIVFTKKEAKLLDFLVVYINQHISYESIVQAVWGDRDISFSAIRDTILRIRKKAPLLHIENIAGVGYCLRDYD